VNGPVKKKTIEPKGNTKKFSIENFQISPQTLDQHWITLVFNDGPFPTSFPVFIFSYSANTEKAL